MNIAQLLNQLPGAVAQGLIWGIMAIGVYITFRILDIADLTVDGSFATGGAVAAILITGGVNPWLATGIAFLVGMLAGTARVINCFSYANITKGGTAGSTYYVGGLVGNNSTTSNQSSLNTIVVNCMFYGQPCLRQQGHRQ